MLDPNSRYVSRLTRDTVAVILAGGRRQQTPRANGLACKAGVTLRRKIQNHRFPLSNCVNSGIRRIGILTQYKAHSLIRHVMAAGATSKGIGRVC